MTFNGKTVLITGAASGIGAATAIHFAKLGASLALTDRNIPELERVSAECKKASKKGPFLWKADLTNEAETKQLVESVIAHCKRLDCLVNCAGIVVYDTIETTSLAQFDHIFGINVRSVYHLTILAVPYLIPTKGCIVNVSSSAGLRPYPIALAYCMTKSALDQFTKCVALELGSKGVRVNSVNPSTIKTQIMKHCGWDDESIAKLYEERGSSNPMGRIGTADEVAKSIAFLASEDSSFTTGINLLVSGGVGA